MYPESDGGEGIGCLVCTDPCERCRTRSDTDCITCIAKYYLDDDGHTCRDCPERCSLCTKIDVCQSINLNTIIKNDKIV